MRKDWKWIKMNETWRILSYYLQLLKIFKSWSVLYLFIMTCWKITLLTTFVCFCNDFQTRYYQISTQYYANNLFLNIWHQQPLPHFRVYLSPNQNSIHLSIISIWIEYKRICKMRLKFLRYCKQYSFDLNYKNHF